MPIYLDRHDLVEKLTREEILEKHLRDVEVGQKYGVRFVTYWYDLTEGVAFCLMEAPSAELAAAVHREAHGAVANRIIEIDPDQVAHFFGRVLSPDGYWENALRIILVAATEGFAALMQRLGDDKAREVLRTHDDIVREALAAHGGRLARHTGESRVAVFDSVVRALHCAAMIQDKIDAHNASAGPAPIRMRIALSAGEPVTEHGELFEAAVDLAARICEFCPPAKVVASAIVHDLCLGKIFRWKNPVRERCAAFPSRSSSMKCAARQTSVPQRKVRRSMRLGCTQG
jgi:class 3 adenylate cyclase